eukprot:EG_transcript_13945
MPRRPTAASAALLACLLWSPSPGTAAHCFLSSFGTDGVGHRVEADLSCIAVAHELGLEFLVQPLRHLEHVSTRLHEWVRFWRYLPEVWNPAFLPVDHPNSKLSSIFSYYSSFRRYNTSMQLKPREPLNWAGHCWKTGWLDDVARRGPNATLCPPDAITVYSHGDCWDRFWCTTALTPHWFAVLPTIQQGYLTGSRPRTGFLPQDINVVFHIRGAKDADDRALSRRYYRLIFCALQSRHNQYLAENPGATHRLRVLVHTDVRRLQPTDVAAAGVEVYREGGLDVHQAFEQMIRADVLVASRSSFSVAAMLVGNMTVIWPKCDWLRRPMRHWHLVDCRTTNVSLSHLPWPPPRGAIQRLRDPPD